MARLRSSLGMICLLWSAVVAGAAGKTVSAQTADQPPGGQQVVEVRIVGNRTIPREKILPHIRTRAGRPFEPEVIWEDVRRLNHTGMFVNVETYTQRVPGGRLVVFEVWERPTLQEVKYVGNRKIRTKILQKEADLKVGDAMDPFAIEEARHRIEEFYRSRGFTKARVRLVAGSKPDDRRAIFQINEGPKQKILWTRFVGNTIASDARLRTQIRSKPPILYIFKGEVDRDQIDEDVNRLTAYYRSLGFFRARIGRELEFNSKQDWAILTFVIDEGPRYKVRNVSFVGNTKFPSEALLSELKLKEGQYFNQSQLTSDVATVQDKYGTIGYIFADVKADPRFLEEPGLLDLVYNVEEGDRYRVGRIYVEIQGEYPHTKITTVLNRISLNPGDIVDIRKLRESERRLRRSGLFEVNPAAGAAPKIVFSPPELDEEETAVAARPKRPKVRGQSPELAPSGGWKLTPGPRLGPGSRVVDLTLPCRRAAPVAPPTGVSPQADPSRVPPVRPAMGPAAAVIRGQGGYDAEGGWAVPQFPPTAPWTAQPREFDRVEPPPAAAFSAPAPAAASPPAADTPPDQPFAVAPPASSTPSTVYGNQWRTRSGPLRRAISGLMRPPPDEGLFSPDSPFFAAPADGDPTRDLDLFPTMRETQTGRLMFGVGINSDAGLMGSIVIDEQNFDWTRIPRSWEDVRNATAFRGAGQRFRLEAIPGTEVQRYMVNFQEPYLFDTPVSLGLSGYFYNRRYREWDEERLGGRISWGYQFTHDLSGVFAFRGAEITIYDPVTTAIEDLREVLGDNALYGFRFQLSHDTRDSAFLATEGHLIELAFEQVTGSYDYPRGEIDVRRYFLLRERPDGSGRHVLSFSGRMGITGSDTPIYDHYYAGGFSTIRGFDFRGASPKVGGVMIGGEFLLLASIQYLFPITADDMLRAVVFCDTGTVEPTINDWHDEYRIAPGFGLRITVPAMGPAPIAVDFAFPVSRQDGDLEEVFSFFVGLHH